VSPTMSFRASSRRARLFEELSALLESKELVLSGLQKQYLRSRWAEQVMEAEDQLRRAARMHHALRLLTVLGCVGIVLLASLGLDAERWPAGAPRVRYLTVALSLLVTTCVAVEHLFAYGDRRRQAERFVERLKSEGWRFLQLSGGYEGYRSHAEGFQAFAAQVESLSQSGVEVYSFDLVRDRGAADAAGRAAPLEVQGPKKSDASARENGQLAAAPAAATMPRVITHQREPQQRAQ
jgi:hypothetical protein